MYGLYVFTEKEHKPRISTRVPDASAPDISSKSRFTTAEASSLSSPVWFFKNFDQIQFVHGGLLEGVALQYLKKNRWEMSINSILSAGR